MGKSIKFKDNTYLDTSSVMHDNGGNYARGELKEYLPNKANGNIFYGATHYLCLGYIQCYLDNDHGYGNITLIVSSSFYGNQHYSTYLISLSITSNVNSGGIKIFGNQGDERLYFKVDKTNNRVYLYALSVGGNSFGAWNTVLLNRFNCKWVQALSFNITKEDTWQEINTPKLT